VESAGFPALLQSLDYDLAPILIDANGDLRTVLPSEFTLRTFNDNLSSLDRDLDTIQDRHRLLSNA
jgi:hypothetical protein